MSSDPIIPRKRTLRAHGQRMVFSWGRQERSVHTLMKAFIWALYLPQYPDMSVEIYIGDRYKPDVISLPPETDPFQQQNDPLFWGEAGQVGRDKIHALVRRYPATHFAIAKWHMPLYPLQQIVEQALDGVARSAPFDLINFAPDSADRFIDARGNIHISHEDLDWLRLEPGS